MPVELTTPVVTPALSEALYPYIWFSMIEIQAVDPNQDADVHVVGHPFRILDDGSRELHKGTPIHISINGLFANSEYDPTILGTVGAALAEATLPQLLGTAQYVLFKALDAKLKANTA
jgi:hypothetical protein